MNINDLALYGFSISLLIQIIVGLAKKLGLPTHYAPHASAGAGLACGIVLAINMGQPVTWGIIIGMVSSAIACGVYDQATGKLIETVTKSE